MANLPSPSETCSRRASGSPRLLLFSGSILRGRSSQSLPIHSPSSSRPCLEEGESQERRLPWRGRKRGAGRNSVGTAVATTGSAPGGAWSKREDASVPGTRWRLAGRWFSPRAWPPSSPMIASHMRSPRVMGSSGPVFSWPRCPAARTADRDRRRPPSSWRSQPLATVPGSPSRDPGVWTRSSRSTHRHQESGSRVAEGSF